MTIDYASFYKRAIAPQRIASQLSRFDVFVSAFNSSERVKRVYDEVRSSKKVWLVHPEYQYSIGDLPAGTAVVCPTSLDERHQVADLLDAIGPLDGANLCIDITGFMRHSLLFLAAKLGSMGITHWTALYSEPDSYAKQEDTTFSTTTTGDVRPVFGMRGSDNPSGREFLLVLVGYDHKLVGQVLDSKDSAEVVPIFGFPSLSPDMYQQSATRTSASGSVALQGAWITNRRFAPANDPFSTASILSNTVQEIDRLSPQANIYIAPLSTKIQTLGAAIYWQLEGRIRRGVTLLIPGCSTYSRETSKGLKRLWAFEVELA
jgi:hypothetical protein